MPSLLKMQVEELENALDRLPVGQRSFAADLCRKFWRFGASEKQAEWIVRLLAIANGEAPAEERPTEQVNVGEVYRLLHLAARHLSWPKIHLETRDRLPVVFSIAGQRARMPGSINVTDGGRFGSNQWYGRILESGTWEQPRTGVPASVSALVHRFAANPAGVAAEHGRASGNCCFCHQKLTTEESISVGYGPVCARNYGLPWGRNAVAVDEIELPEPDDQAEAEDAAQPAPPPSASLTDLAAQFE